MTASTNPQSPAVSLPAGAAEPRPPLGEAVTPGLPSRTPVAGQPGSPSGIEAWKAALAAHSRAKRNGRGKRPPPPITGVRAVLRPRGEQR